MRVKTGKLKTHLSQYLKTVRESGETIEVCVREETVAYLVPAGSETKETREAARELEGLQQRLRSRGITLREGPPASGELPACCPVVAGDGRTGISSVSEVRQSKDW